MFRRAALLLILAGIVGTGVWWFPVVRERVVLYMLQRRCLNHAPPTDEIVYAAGAEQASALMSDGRYRHFAGPPQAAFLVPQYWSDFYAALSPPGFKSHGTVFLGEMKTPAGDRRLVGVDLVIDSSSEVLLTTRVVEPGSPFRRPRLMTANIYRFPSNLLLHQPVNPGRIDSQHPAHVLLFGGRLDGLLREDSVNSWRSDYVVLYARDLTPPAPSSPASLPTAGRPATRPSASPAAR